MRFIMLEAISCNSTEKVYDKFPGKKAVNTDISNYFVGPMICRSIAIVFNLINPGSYDGRGHRSFRPIKGAASQLMDAAWTYQSWGPR